MRKWLIALLLMIGAGALVVWRMPADLVVKVAQPEQLGIDLEEIEGTVWDGEVDDFKYRDLDLGKVGWELEEVEDWSTQKTRWKLDGEGPEHHFDMWLSMTPEGEYTIRDGSGFLPAKWIDVSRFLPMINLDGKLDFDIDELELIDELPSSGTGRIDWSGAGITGAVEESFGRLQMTFTPAQGAQQGIDFEFRSLQSSDIRFTGSGRLNMANYEITVGTEVSPRRQDMHEFFREIGSEFRDGKYWLSWGGSIH